jgi:hypothetical protein
MNIPENKKAVGIGVGAFLATALVARSRLVQAGLLLGGAGYAAHRIRGREREWHEVPETRAP